MPMTREELSIIAALQPTVTPPPRERPGWVRRLRHRVRRAIRRRHRGRIVDGLIQGQTRAAPCDFERAHAAAERNWREAYINAQAQLGVF
jgi:hypothetical protein